MNVVLLTGNLGKDAEVRDFDSGRSVINFSIATDESYTKDGKRVPQTEWHDCQTWRDQQAVLKIAALLKKGSRVEIQGRNLSQKYENKDGQTVTKKFIDVKKFNVLPSASNGEE